MIWVDWALLAIIGLSVVVGLWRGFVREVFSIFIWIVAVWIAFRYSGAAAGWLEGWIELPSARAIAAFAGLLIITLIVGGLAGWLLGKIVDSTGLGGTDRMIGMLFGLLRGLVIIIVALLIARFTPFPQDPWWQQSRLLPYFERLAEHSVQWLPQNLQDMLHDLEDDQQTEEEIEAEEGDNESQTDPETSGETITSTGISLAGIGV